MLGKRVRSETTTEQLRGEIEINDNTLGVNEEDDGLDSSERRERR